MLAHVIWKSFSFHYIQKNKKKKKKTEFGLYIRIISEVIHKFCK